MAKQNARELLVKAKIGTATTFEMICGLTTRSITLNSNLVDVTSINCEDPGGPVWRETIPGIQSMDISGNGYFDHAEQFFALYDAQKSDSGLIDMEIVFPTVGTFAGKFAVGSMDISGDLEGAISQSLSLQSVGVVALTRIPGGAVKLTTAPVGGITAELGGKTRPLMLRNAEPERFEDAHAPLGVFEVLDRFVKPNATKVQVRHCRDLVTLGMIGAGMSETQASRIMDDIPPSGNVMLRSVAQSVLIAAFLPPEGAKPGKPDPVGSEPSPERPDGTPGERIRACVGAGLKPADVRAMTPGDLVLFIDGWNRANGNDEPEAMTAERYAELAERYG